MEATLTIDMKKRRRIGNFGAIALIFTAFIIDGIQFVFSLIGLVPFVGLPIATTVVMLISIMAWIMFYIWLKVFHDIDFMDGLMRKAVTFFGAGLIEAVPLLGALPGWTVGMIALVIIVRAEDSLYNKNLPTLQNNIVRSVGRRIMKAA